MKTPKITVCNTYPTPTAEYGGCFLPTEDYEGINELKDKQMVSLSKDYYADQAISDLETFWKIHQAELLSHFLQGTYTESLWM